MEKKSSHYRHHFFIYFLFFLNEQSFLFIERNSRKNRWKPLKKSIIIRHFSSHPKHLPTDGNRRRNSVKPSKTWCNTVSRTKKDGTLSLSLDGTRPSLNVVMIVPLFTPTPTPLSSMALLIVFFFVSSINDSTPRPLRSRGRRGTKSTRILMMSHYLIPFESIRAAFQRHQRERERERRLSYVFGCWHRGCCHRAETTSLANVPFGDVGRGVRDGPYRTANQKVPGASICAASRKRFSFVFACVCVGFAFLFWWPYCTAMARFGQQESCSCCSQVALVWQPSKSMMVMMVLIDLVLFFVLFSFVFGTVGWGTPRSTPRTDSSSFTCAAGRWSCTRRRRCSTRTTSPRSTWHRRPASKWNGCILFKRQDPAKLDHHRFVVAVTPVKPSPTRFHLAKLGKSR